MLAVFLAQLLPWCTMARAETPIRLNAVYDITFAGLPAGREDISAAIWPGRYEIHANTRSLGAPELLVHFRSQASASGALAADGTAAPFAHDALNRWRGKDRHVRLRYEPGGIAADVAPDARHDAREPVPPEAWAGTVDPITAAWRLMAGAGTAAPCSAKVAVFDGRRRYDLEESEPRAESWEGPLPGPATVCRIAYVDLGGRSRNPFWPRSREPKKAEVWFRNLDSRLPPMAVLARASAGPMPIAIRLSRLEIDGKPLIGEAFSPAPEASGH